MFRLWFLTFFGESRAETAGIAHSTLHTSHSDSHAVHESPWSMLTPLILLAILSTIGGAIGIERFGGFLAPVAGPVLSPAEQPGGTNLDYALSAVAVGVALIGWLLARLYYGRKSERPAQIAAAVPGIYNLLLHKYWIDELYNRVLVQPLMVVSRYVLFWVVECGIVRGSAWLLAGIATLLGEFVRRWQSGNLRSYAGWLAFGAAVLLFAVLGVAMGANGMDVHLNWAGR